MPEKCGCFGTSIRSAARRLWECIGLRRKTRCSKEETTDEAAVVSEAIAVSLAASLTEAAPVIEHKPVAVAMFVAQTASEGEEMTMMEPVTVSESGTEEPVNVSESETEVSETEESQTVAPASVEATVAIIKAMGTAEATESTADATIEVCTILDVGFVC